MITEEQAVDGTEVIFDGTRATVVQGKTYQDPELGLMVKTAAFPGGMPATKFELATNKPEAPATEVAKTPKAVIVFMGKLVGDTEETEITPALIEERSKPLLALKIKGMLDNEGAEAVKAAIQKAVKMRTLVEKQEEPEIKRVNDAAKNRVAAIREISKPIYEACMKTQNALQATYNKWEAEVQAARQKEEEEHKAKTDGREKKMFEVGMTWNGEFFAGYGRSYAKEYLYGLTDITFFELVGELEGFQMEASATGKITSTPSPITTLRAPTGMSGIAITKAGDVPFSDTKPAILFDNAVYDKTLPDGTRILLTQGQVDIELNFLVKNDRVKQSGIYVQVIK